MKLVLFTTGLDKGRLAIEREAKKMSLPCQIYFYRDLVYKNGKILALNLDPLAINKDDKIILRDPYSTGIDYSFFVRKILKEHYRNILFDRECYSRFPFYEDKLFQADFFLRLGIATPDTFLGKRINRFLEFPVIVKPRIGSRSRGVRIFNNSKEMEIFFARKNLADYIVQKYYKAKNEHRIMILKHRVLGVVDKRVHLKSRGRIGVTLKKVVNSLPERVRQDAVKVTRAMKADFVGIDVVHANNGGYYFLEVNLSPQFGAFAKATGINVARRVAVLARP